MKSVLLKKDSPQLIHYVSQISELEKDDTSGFRQSQAKEMILCFKQSRELVGKVEFHPLNEQTLYIDWIVAKPPAGIATFYTLVDEVLRPRGIKVVEFFVSTSPDENEETICKRMNFYHKIPNLHFVKVVYDEDNGSTGFYCRINL